VSLSHNRSIIRNLTIAALSLIGLMTALPAHAATCAASNQSAFTSVSSLVSGSAALEGASGTTIDGVVSPQMIQWNIFETNMGSLPKCQALMAKMKKAYPPSYHWLCESYQTNTCPSYERWTLFFGENNV